MDGGEGDDAAQTILESLRRLSHPDFVSRRQLTEEFRVESGAYRLSGSQTSKSPDRDLRSMASSNLLKRSIS
ncbi:MAG: hypothetical protein QOD32_2379 [Pyrinomonadaceae bacterium]|nr:hypothetical protein [Pyrinomonadaceae bacterium]